MENLVEWRECVRLLHNAMASPRYTWYFHIKLRTQYEATIIYEILDGVCPLENLGEQFSHGKIVKQIFFTFNVEAFEPSNHVFEGKWR